MEPDTSGISEIVVRTDPGSIADISVTVSSSIVRSLDKTITLLEEAKIWDGRVVGLTDKQVEEANDTADLLELLFLLPDRTLVKNMQYGYWMCRSMGWYASTIELAQLLGVDLKSFLFEGVSVLRRVVDGEIVEEEGFGDLEQFCIAVSDAIWDHFIGLFKELFPKKPSIDPY